MKMNNLCFNPQRFALLVKHDLLLNYKSYLFTMIVAFILFYVILFYVLTNSSYHFYGLPRYSRTFTECTILCGVFIGLAFPLLRTKAGTVNYLLLPGSAIEKYTSQFLIRFVLGSAVFLALFWLAARLAYLSALHTDSVQEYISQGGYIEPFSYTHWYLDFPNTGLDAVLMLLSTGMAIFGIRLLFKRFSLPKTVLALVASACAVWLISVGLCHLFYPADTVGFQNRIPDYYIFPNVHIWVFVMKTLFFSIGPVMLAAGYLKLKEREL